LGNNLKNIEWFDKTNELWLKLKEDLLTSIEIEEAWKNYLRTSGSMIEYYQMYLAYQSMEKYEKDNNFTYDYVLRCRTDVVVKDVIDFYKIMDINYLKTHCFNLKSQLTSLSMVSETFLNTFMFSFYNPKRLLYEMIEPNTFLNNPCFMELIKIREEDQFIDSIVEYIKKGKYMISIRKNLVYFVKRDQMSFIYPLGITYGKYKYEEDHYYWFNAETQLENICKKSGIDIFNTTTLLEELSLYQYEKGNYFNEHEDTLKEGGYSLFIKRC